MVRCNEVLTFHPHMTCMSGIPPLKPVKTLNLRATQLKVLARGIQVEPKSNYKRSGPLDLDFIKMDD